MPPPTGAAALGTFSQERRHLVAAARCADGSKQQVRYVGKSPEFVAQVQRELMQLQANTRSAQQLRRLIREANECLRKTKHQLEPLLSLAGRCFYGREIRRWRGHDDVCV